jgi:hypothetical protein
VIDSLGVPLGHDSAVVQDQDSQGVAHSGLECFVYRCAETLDLERLLQVRRRRHRERGFRTFG